MPSLRTGHANMFRVGGRRGDRQPRYWSRCPRGQYVKTLTPLKLNLLDLGFGLSSRAKKGQGSLAHTRGATQTLCEYLTNISITSAVLMTDTRVGLTEAEVAGRRKKYGLNQMRYVSLSSPDFLVPGGEAGVWMPSLPGYLREHRESWSAAREQVLGRRAWAGGSSRRYPPTLDSLSWLD